MSIGLGTEALQNQSKLIPKIVLLIDKKTGMIWIALHIGTLHSGQWRTSTSSLFPPQQSINIKQGQTNPQKTPKSI